MLSIKINSGRAAENFAWVISAHAALYWWAFITCAGDRTGAG